MSQIPFVNQLGDALEAAAARSRRPARRPRRRRPFAYVAIGAVLIGGSAIAAGVLPGDERTASVAVNCYLDASLDGEPILEDAGTRSPVAVCAAALRDAGKPADALVACSHGPGNGPRNGTLAVVPGRSARACQRPGLVPLAPDFERARVKIARLERDLIRLEAKVDCLPPAALAARVRRLLARTGWRGWTSQPSRAASANGPCGTVITLGGAEGGLTTGFDSRTRTIVVDGGFAQSIEDRLYGDGYRNGPLARLDRASSARCMTTSALTRMAKRAFSAARLDMRADVGPLPPHIRIGHPGATLYDQGCAVVAGVQPDADPRTVVLNVYAKP